MGVIRTDLYLKESFKVPCGDMDCRRGRVEEDQDIIEIDQVKKDVRVNQGDSSGGYEKQVTISLKIKLAAFAEKQDKKYDNLISSTNTTKVVIRATEKRCISHQLKQGIPYIEGAGLGVGNIRSSVLYISFTCLLYVNTWCQTSEWI